MSGESVEMVECLRSAMQAQWTAAGLGDHSFPSKSKVAMLEKSAALAAVAAPPAPAPAPAAPAAPGLDDVFQ